jgi:hypothetical protein
MGEKKFSSPNAVLKATGFGAVKDVQEGSGAAVFKTTTQVTRDLRPASRCLLTACFPLFAVCFIAEA